MFGASTLCARCNKPCYAAEQVMGPGRKIYHKRCLTCTECNKRLDSLQLVEHDREPYCKPCHLRLFGTRDLRHNNLTPNGTPDSPPKSTLSPRADLISPRLGTPRFRGVSEEDELDAQITSSPIPRSRAFHPANPLPSIDSAENTPEPIKSAGSRPLPMIPSRTGDPPSPTKMVHPTLTGDLSFRPPSPPISAGLQSPTKPDPAVRPTSPPTTPRRPIPMSPGRTGTSSFPHLPPPASKPLFPSGTGSSTPGSPARFGGVRVECPRCGKAVYFAEQVVAAGKKWHKSCLRCESCSTQLDSTKLTERDGTPFCRACYAKNFGPSGVGYALLGKLG
ncbi:LIM-domain-containing protein [Dacryopinax primogenitus]|uniref:LIM-domain-containing protein n=1 Tax=Dacryopinax primogenitus (strain DJM 731) TaxID=1858805 RepID=M5FWZ3_DACPD|nr:LIM-domain-containing protein [Dacryopinax primogenitus]EJU00205.1 LIM-domain-containing protein [Dacryopinax primogenitus]